MFIGVYGASVFLTYLGLVFSVVGMFLAFSGFIPASIMCLILSGICDMFDGTVARACKRDDFEKKFGIQIDSLVDTVSFGVFPIIIGICMGFTSKVNIIIYVMYVLAAVIRLAYFNVHAEEKTFLEKKGLKKEKVTYYTGLPVTSIAIILPFTYNINIFMNVGIFNKAYPLVMLATSILFILNIKIKKPTGLWFVVCSILAAIEIAIISSVIR